MCSFVEGQVVRGQCESGMCRRSAQLWSTRSLLTWAKASGIARLTVNKAGMSTLPTREGIAEVLQKVSAY